MSLIDTYLAYDVSRALDCLTSDLVEINTPKRMFLATVCVVCAIGFETEQRTAGSAPDFRSAMDYRVELR